MELVRGPAQIPAKFVSVAETLALLGLRDRAAVYRLLQTGQLRGVKISPRRWLIELASIDGLCAHAGEVTHAS
jgi:hypothetical protein